MAGSHRTRLVVLTTIGLVLAVAAPASAAAMADASATSPESVTDGPYPSTRPTPTSEPAPRPSVSPTVIAPPEWSPARCATGAITEFRPELDQLGQPAVWISGWIQPCADAGSTSGFTVIRYYGDRGVRSRGIMPYRSPSEPTTFGLQITGIRFVLQHDVTAICVAYDVDGRAACLGVDAGEPGELPAVEPISTGDPRVLGPVSRENVYTPDPICGTCL